MIRVLQVVTHMNRGGLETMLMNYYRHIDRTQVQFDFLVHRQKRAAYDDEIESLGGNIYCLPNLNPFSKRYLKALDEFMKNHKEYHVIHSHLDCMAGIPLKYAKKQGIPVRIAHAHNNNQPKDNKYLLKLWYKRNIFRYATELFACSKEAGNWMFNGKKFSVLNNAIASEQYKYDALTRKTIRTELRITDDNLVVGHVGRFCVQKNHIFILKVFNELLEYRKNAKLLLIGDGELRSETENQAIKLGIRDSIIFTGVKENVHELMQAMDVFLFPSLFEGLGIVAIEAQAAGIPCFISDKVPLECKKTDLVTQLSLEESPKVWAKELLNVRVEERQDAAEVIKRAGYDIVENARKLEKFYIDAHYGRSKQ